MNTHSQAGRSVISRLGTFAGSAIFALSMLMMAVLVFFLVHSRINGTAPAIAGQQLYIVLSGSMNPTFNTGSVVFVKPVAPESLRPGDIITFKGFDDKNTLITHRIVSVEQQDPLSFITRGDANDASDPAPVPAGDIVGSVTYAIPYVGYLVEFSRQKEGLLSLIIIPGILIIVFELRTLFKLAAQDEKEMQKNVAHSHSSGKADVQA